jgi:hypothetical protein
MFYKGSRKKSIPEDEEDSDLIINNDEFCILNESKTIEQNLLKLNNNNQMPKLVKSEQKNNLYQNNRILLKNPKIPKITSDKINITDNDNITNSQNTDIHKKKINNNEEKTIFSKITEDLYLDSVNNIKPKKKMNDFNKIKDDNYNKLTVENYLFTCADKENSKNQKIISDFIERKNKEQICKKIAINQKSSSKNVESSQKKHSTDYKRIKRSRSPEQFLDDQKVLEKRHKNYMDKLVKIHNEEINLRIKDRPTISKESERLANLNKNNNKDIHIKLYEEFNLRKKNIEEKNKNAFTSSECGTGANKKLKLDNEQILENTKRLYKEYEKKIMAINENQTKQLNEIKNLSSYSLINKNSNSLILKRFINIYKNVLHILFNKNISDNFDFAFGDFLLFIYKLGLVDKDYNYEKVQKEKFKQILKNLNINENIIKTDNDDEFNINTNNTNTKSEIKQLKTNIQKVRNISPEVENHRKNLVDFSYKVLKRNTFLKTKSAGKKLHNNLNENNIYENDKQFKLAKDAWKIMTKNKVFKEELLVGSIKVFLFFLSLCGIYKGKVNDTLIKQNFSFLLNNQNELIDVETAKHIYKYFYIYRNSIISNGIEKNKPKKKDSEIRNIELKKIERNSKSFIKKSYHTSFSKDRGDNKDKNKEIMNKRNKKLFNISKNKTGYKSYFNIKNKLNLYSNTNSFTEKVKDNNCNKVLKLDKNKINKRNINKKNNNRIKNLATARYQNKLFKNVKKDIHKDENLINDYSLKRNLKKINQNHNSNSSLNSNSLFCQNAYEPQLNKNNNNIDKPSNGAVGGDAEHFKEKKSSISQYIFNEDYRIKDDIESNSNFNDNEINKEKNIAQKNNENFINNIYKDNNNDIYFNKKGNKNSLNEESNYTNKNANNEKIGGTTGSKKKKYIFKIKVRDEIIKLVINKGDDVYFKINEFCQQNNLDEDDKEQIIEAVNLKLLGTK